MTKRKQHVLFVHPNTLRPGCVLLQAIYGGDQNFLNRHVNSEYWLIDDIGDGLVPRIIYDDQIQQFKGTLDNLAEAGWPDLKKETT